MNLINEEDLRRTVLNPLQLGGEVNKEGYIQCITSTIECTKCYFYSWSSGCSYNDYIKAVAKLVSSNQFKQAYPEHFI